MAGRFISLISFKKARPNNWIGFVDNTTGYRFNKGYKDFYELKSHVESFRKENNIPPVSQPFRSLQDELQAFFCADPDIARECVQNERYAGKLPFFQKVYKGATALIETAMGDKWVSREKAEERARICLGCPYNDTDTKFYITDELMKAVVNSMKTPVEGDLGVCGVCSCPLKPKVWFPADVCYRKLSKNEKAKMRQKWVHKFTKESRRCWQISEIEGD